MVTTGCQAGEGRFGNDSTEVGDGPQQLVLWRLHRQGVLVLALLAVAGGWLGWRTFGRARPNVLLITLDTTRADRLGCYGYAPALTPALDALASRGLIFDRAYTPAPLTLPAHASLMTGLYPPEHGLLTNGRGRLDEGISTLAEVFRDAGYDTAAIVGSFVLHSKFGLHRGFKQYDDDMTNTAPTRDGLHRRRDGAWVVDSALSWLQRRRTKPFFCWVHLYDVHAPYLAHAEDFGERFDESPYDAGIAYVDRQVQRLLDHFQTRGLTEQTLVIVVGDHGEGLGEHDEHEHGLTLYNSIVQVPWIWAGPGASAVGKRVAQPVSLVDLRPTLLESVGLRDPHKSSGRSLRAALAGEQIASENCYCATDDPLLQFDWSPQRSLTTETWKFIRSPEPELYDLASDPHEIQNLAAARPEQVRVLENQLAALEQTMTIRQGVAVELSPREQQALTSLGYVAGPSSPQPPGTARDGAAPEHLPDVKRMLPLLNRMDAGKRLQIGGDLPAAERLLRELIREAPDYLPAQVKLAAVLGLQKTFLESREILLDVLERDPHNSDAHFQLGTLLAAQQQFAEAAEEFQKSLASESKNSVVVLFSLAKALVQLGRVEEADSALIQLLEQDPLFLDAHLELAKLLGLQEGRAPEAEQHYLEVLKYAPTSVEAHSNLAILLAGQNRLEEAEAHFARAVALLPKNAELRYQYGTLLLFAGRVDEGIVALEEALRLDPQHAQARMRLEMARKRRSVP